MSALDQIVSIAISQQATAVAQESFAVPLIVGPTANGWGGSDYVHTYTSPAGMLTDGYTTGSPEYLYALAMFSQLLPPTQFKVGKRSTAVAQIDTFTVSTLTVGHAYTITVNGVAYSYTAIGGDTQQAVLGQLNTLIQAAQPVTGVVTGSGGTAALALTATTPGAAVTYSAIDSFLARTANTAANGVAADLAKILAQDATWYGLAVCGATDADILQAAAWVEGNKKLYIAISGTAGIATTSTTDLASALKAAGYKRTALVYSPANLTSGLDAAWLSSCLAATPGAINWAFKNLSGATADTLSSTAISSLVGTPVSGVRGKNANIYTAVGGVAITQMGTSAAGQYLDITVGLDWLYSQLQTNVYGALVNAGKVPYTDAGVTLLMNAVRSAIDQGVANGLIDGDSAIKVTAPAVATVTSNQRANRIAPTITFACRLQGAFNAVAVAGTVTV